MTLSIRSKMITTSTLLVAFVVFVFGFVTNSVVQDDLAEDQRRVSQHRMQGMRESGLLLTQMVAEGALPLLAENQIPNLRSLLVRLVTGSQTAGVDITGAAILDDRGRVLTKTPEDFDVVDLDLNSDLAQIVERAEEGAGFYTVAPVESETLRLGYTVIGFGTGPLTAELAEIESYTERRIDQNRKNTIILGGLALILGLLIAIAQSLRISNPILRLAGSAQRIAAGDLEERARVHGKDEIGILSSSFNNMADRINGLLTETAEKATMQKELEVARIIQETLLPPTGIIERPPLKIFGYFRSATVCGGDFWNVTDLEDGRTLIVVGDVTGHGVPSAMITAAAKSSMDTVRHIKGKNLSLTYLLEEMNRTIFASAKRKFVMTFFALAYDRARSQISFANAGHNFPFLLARDQGKLDIRSLVARGNRLGDVEESRYMEQTIPVQAGDTLVLYTDGLTEYRNSEGREYSERRLRRVLQKHAALDPDELGKTILRDLSGFAAQAPQEDDVTLVVVKICPPASVPRRPPASSTATG